MPAPQASFPARNPAPPPRESAVAIKALARVFAAWRLPAPESARLAGVSERTWSRMKAAAWTGTLSDDERTRASALIGLYKALHLNFGDELADRWPRLPNRGPLFGGLSPVAHMLAGGLPAILATRDYVDALRGGV
jgi:uncharacterized protein (DUF2384 family)